MTRFALPLQPGPVRVTADSGQVLFPECQHERTLTVWRYIACDRERAQWPHRRGATEIEIIQIVCEDCEAILEERNG